MFPKTKNSSAENRDKIIIHNKMNQNYCNQSTTKINGQIKGGENISTKKQTKIPSKLFDCRLC